MKKGYHFTGKNLRSGAPIPAIGDWVRFNRKILVGDTGLYMAVQPFDALYFANGSLLHRVELDDDLQLASDEKEWWPADCWVGRRRRILKTIDAEPVMRHFACWCALQVAHLWKCPDMVRHYLRTRDPASMTMAKNVTRGTATFIREGQEETLNKAGWSNIWVESCDAATAAASVPVWAAARDAAYHAIEALAAHAVRQSANSAAIDQAWRDGDDAKHKARMAYRRKFNSMVEAAFVR